jgi:hypothetical protein
LGGLEGFYGDIRNRASNSKPTVGIYTVVGIVPLTQ